VMLVRCIRCMSARQRAQTAAVIIAMCVPATRMEAQIAFSSELQGALYPQEAIGRPARQADFRGWAQVDYKQKLSERLSFQGDLIAYGPHDQSALADGTAALVWRTQRIEIAGGLLRERWGRFTNSYLDVLGPPNTVFSLLRPETRLSQPTIRTTAFFAGVALDVYVLAGGRLQPLPDTNRRFSLGAPARNVVRRGGMGDQAVAFRLSGTKGDIDWSTHAYAGRSRRPTFVPRSTSAGQLAGIDAVYTDIRQFGGEFETTVADWRLMAEGFSRQGGVDVTGRQRTYGHVATAAEYQRFGAFGRKYDIIPRFEVTADTRGDRADLPFASSMRAGTRIVKAGLLPLQIEAAYAYDWSLRGRGVIASVEKTVAESPMLRLGFRFTNFSHSVKPSLLNIWNHDLELSAYLRIEVSKR
jgi:hypothetical protein